MQLILLKDTFKVIKLNCLEDPSVFFQQFKNKSNFFSVTKTGDEISIICDQTTPLNSRDTEDNWRALKIDGTLDFQLVGILSSFLQPLAQANISILAVSTYLTDYLFVKQKNIQQTISIFQNLSHTINVEN